jgi:hypothetical protein
LLALAHAEKQDTKTERKKTLPAFQPAAFFLLQATDLPISCE